MTTDPIADYLTRLRNAIMARKKVVEVPASGLKKDITRILYDKGYILSWKLEEDGKQGLIKIALKYDPQTRQSAIRELSRVSTPGLRQVRPRGRTAPRAQRPRRGHHQHQQGRDHRQGGPHAERGR
jgi:small subunit ribosomal protein S8